MSIWGRLWRWLSGVTSPVDEKGGIESIEGFLQSLMRSERSDAFRFIAVDGTDDFVQFTGDEGGVQLDMPLIADRQRSLEPAFRKACKLISERIETSEGSGGETFLDVKIEGTAAEIAEKVKVVMAEMYQVSEETPLRFTLDSFE